MATPFHVTPQQPIVIAVDASDKRQSLHSAVDLLGYDAIDLELGVLFIPGATVYLRFITGMQLQSEDGWLTLYQLPITSAPYFEVKTFDKGFLRYGRWAISSNFAGNACFFMRGMGRRLGGG